MNVRREDAKYYYEEFLKAIGLDTSEEHLRETAGRVVCSRVDELFRGMREDPRDHLKITFSDIGQYEGDAGWVIVDNISVKSQCSHHFLPFRGVAHVGYIPREQAVGLSKLSRVVDGYARRPQVQERLTNQVANAVQEELDPLATCVVMECEHECMAVRGVQEPNATTRTSAVRGEAREETDVKDEFLQLVGGLNE